MPSRKPVAEAESDVGSFAKLDQQQPRTSVTTKIATIHYNKNERIDVVIPVVSSTTVKVHHHVNWDIYN